MLTNKITRGRAVFFAFLLFAFTRKNKNKTVLVHDKQKHLNDVRDAQNIYHISRDVYG